MAFNPKVSLKELKQKDVSKKDIIELAKKANSPETALPFFIKADHKFPDGQEGPLFLFGKLGKVKNDIKSLKGPLELHGAAYVTQDEKGVTTLNLLPNKGQLNKKDTTLQRAMKEAFTSSYANYKIGAGLTDEELAKMAEAVEQTPDEEDSKPKVEEDTKPKVEDLSAEQKQELIEESRVRKATEQMTTARDFLKQNTNLLVNRIKADKVVNDHYILLGKVQSTLTKTVEYYEKCNEKQKAATLELFKEISELVPTIKKIDDKFRKIAKTIKE